MRQIAFRAAPPPAIDESDPVAFGAVPLHGPEGFEAMRKAGRAAAETLDYLTPFVKPGVTTAELDRLVEAYINDHGWVSATIGYQGSGPRPYEHATCISLNHVVCHGIPGDRRLQDGDILNIDVTVIVDGWFGDTSRMFQAGEVSVKARRLCDVTYEALLRGIAAVRPGATLGDIGHAIESLARAERFSVVTDFCGHGVGRVFHCPPSVMHVGRPGEGTVLKPGMIFTIEPMINVGRPHTKILNDGWTAVTADKTLSAQFEHSVGVTETGVEIFTLSPAGYGKPPYNAP